MHRQERDKLVYYTFESLDAYCGLAHAISTRHGGSSTKPFASLNLSKSVGDDPECVDSNKSAFHRVLQLDPSTTVSARQARADAVAVAGREDAGGLFNNVDAILTKERGLPLLLRYADCVPILLYDPVNHATGVVHAGWSGTVLCVAAKTIMVMARTFGTKPADLVVGIGPSIGPCCYCIGPDVIARVRAAFSFADELLDSKDGRVFFDLWEANARQMKELGVHKIEFASVCTSHHTDDFYSARAEKPITGRFGAIVALH